MRPRKAAATALLTAALLGLYSARTSPIDGRYPTAEYRLTRRQGGSELHSLVGVTHSTGGDSPEFPVTDYLGQPIKARDGVINLRHKNERLDRNAKEWTVFWGIRYHLRPPTEYLLRLRTADGGTLTIPYLKVVDTAEPTGEVSVAAIPSRVDFGEEVRKHHRAGPLTEYDFPVYTFTVE